MSSTFTTCLARGKTLQIAAFSQSGNLKTYSGKRGWGKESLLKISNLVKFGPFGSTGLENVNL